jgi:hypothetical protein
MTYLGRGGSELRELYFSSALLKTESKLEFAKIVAELEKDIQPGSFVARMYVKDIANIVWEIMRLNRVKSGIINNAWQDALRNVLKKILFPPGLTVNLKVILAPHQLAYEWFVNEEAKQRVSFLLEEAGLDWYAVEAEACRLMLTELERLDRLLSSARARWEKSLRFVAEYEESVSQKIRKSSERLLNEDSVSTIAA